MPTVYSTDRESRRHLEEEITGELARDQNVVFAYLYGSFVEAERFHDIDVGVYFTNVDQDAAGARALELAQRLTARLNIPVDVRVLNAAPVPFRYHVLRGRLILSRDEEQVTTVMEDTVRRYLDIAPLLRHSAKEAFAA